MLTLAENKLEANSPAMQYLTKADELRISQVIINFLSNAVKFTSEGEIIVTFRQMMLQNGVADWCSMRQRLGLVCLVYWCCLQHFCFACWSFCGWFFCGAKRSAIVASRRQERIFYKKDKLFWLLALWGMDAALGWKTEKTDRALTLRLPAVSEGEYQRICSLLEKTVYGGIMLEPFEERALDRFLYHLTGQDMKKSLGMWLKLHYACLKKRK